jgi:hypothetical protein
MDRRKAALCALALFILNVSLVRELFTVEYTRYMGSIAGAYVSLAAQLAKDWDLKWWPLWYNGIPYQNTYPPLLHWITGLTARVAHVSAAHSYQAVTSFFYCIGPVTLFWMAFRLSGLVWQSFAGGLLYSLFSPSTLLMSNVRTDVGSVFHARRLQALVMYGEGPHITSMALLPLAIVLLDIALERRRPVFYVLAALGMASVVLSNWLGAFALATAMIAYLLSRQRGEWQRVLPRSLALAALAYAFAAPWIPPSTLATIRLNAQRIGGPFQMGAAQAKYAAVLAIALVLLWAWIDQRKLAANLRFFLIFAFFMCTVTLAYGWLQVHLMPQPDRYHLEMEMALAPLAVFALAAAARRLGRVPRAAVILSFAVFCFLQVKPYRHAGRDMAIALDIHGTSEYKVSEWIDRNIHGLPVYVSGSEYFWLNAFTGTPQLAGGFEQGVTNQLEPALQYELFSGEGTNQEGELGALWLKAFGIHAVAVSGPRSTEVYKPYRNWKKFDGLLPVLWRDGDDVIYRVLPDSASLAHVLRPEDRLTRTPTSVLDVDFLRAYDAPLENPDLPRAPMTWFNRHHASVMANMQKNQLLSVQVTYHPGWRARVNGVARRVMKDPIGLLLIAPECEGPCVVDLEYGADTEMLVALTLSWTALLGALAWMIVPPLRMRYWNHESVPRH